MSSDEESEPQTVPQDFADDPNLNPSIAFEMVECLSGKYSIPPILAVHCLHVSTGSFAIAEEMISQVHLISEIELFRMFEKRIWTPYQDLALKFFSAQQKKGLSIWTIEKLSEITGKQINEIFDRMAFLQL
jgi:hypothetical protein